MNQHQNYAFLVVLLGENKILMSYVFFTHHGLSSFAVVQTIGANTLLALLRGDSNNTVVGLQRGHKDMTVSSVSP